MSSYADLLIVNARVITLDPARPTAEAIGVRSGRIQAIGTQAGLLGLRGPRTEVIDAAGCLAVPAFHDAHLHLLSYARAHAHLDCSAVGSIRELQDLLARHTRSAPAGAWVRTIRYDDVGWPEGYPDRRDLDAAVPDQPVRVQHRSLHLEILNTCALRLTGLLDAWLPEVERDSASGEPTGRIYRAGEVLRDRVPRATEAEIAADVEAATRQLLSWGVTSVQDASVTNGAEEWALFDRLAARGSLRVRTFVMPGSPYWREVVAAAAESATLSVLRRGGGDHRKLPPPLRGRVGEGGEFGPSLRLGPVKFMLDERTTDPGAVRAGIQEVWKSGRAAALHAVTEAEVAIALEVLRDAPASIGPGPNRIEHCAVLPDDLVDEVRRSRAMVVGQPSLVYERGDVYRDEFRPEMHGWLHRARSLLAAGIPYAVGSDAPVTNPSPNLGFQAARRRVTKRGAFLGADEALDLHEALAAFTLGPAQGVGAAHALGRLRPGALADIAILEPTVLQDPEPKAWQQVVRSTLIEGDVVWSR